MQGSLAGSRDLSVAVFRPSSPTPEEKSTRPISSGSRQYDISTPTEGIKIDASSMPYSMSSSGGRLPPIPAQSKGSSKSDDFENFKKGPGKAASQGFSEAKGALDFHSHVNKGKLCLTNFHTYSFASK
jgi:hypothetical protein